MDPSADQEQFQNPATVESSNIEVSLNNSSDEHSLSKSQIQPDEDRYCYSNSLENSDSPPAPTSPHLLAPLDEDFTDSVTKPHRLESPALSTDSLPLEVSLRVIDRVDVDLKFNKNSDPLPKSSDDKTSSSPTGKDSGEVSPPGEDVFFAELRSKKPPSPLFPSKRKMQRKSVQEPPSLPQISPGRSSVFYAPLEENLIGGSTSLSQTAKSPPSKRHSSSIHSKHQYPTLFELSCGDTDSIHNLSIVERIEREYKIKEGTIKLFNAAKSLQQSMEAAKSYFTSNAKIIALLRKLQSSKVEEREQLDEDRTGSILSVDITPEPSKATISLSHIRIPLEWKEFDGIKNPIETGWVFCLFKLEGEVTDTQTLIQVDRNINDISFPDVIVLPINVSHDFRLEIEVYFSQGLFGGKDAKVFSKGNRSRAKTKWSSDSISSQTSSYDSPTNMPRYHLAGFSSLKLADLSEGLYTYKLTKGAVGSSPTASTHTFSSKLLPLWGQICCHIYVVPTCVKGSRKEGFVDIHIMMNESPVWKHYWCVIKQRTLCFWNAPEDSRTNTPIHSLPLTIHMEVKRPRAEDGTFRKNSLIIADGESKQHAIAFTNKEERDVWSKEISGTICDLQVWRNYATKVSLTFNLVQ
eukprot:TRINITY_DN1364_c0_g3_i2.p1 TRINITY_DN1364_c0_g3~~TRINITY_DN1364_c0_g3_i2.p1  ORF type:complete len:635 (+),score=122.20 TRINITY_DN1364_c0_g3_i2:79-1983(+)